MIETAIIAGLFGLWVWTVLNDEEGMFALIPRLLFKNSVTKKWLICPWCSGAWFSGGASLILFHPSIAPAVITALAAAAITGIVGSYIQGD